MDSALEDCQSGMRRLMLVGVAVAHFFAGVDRDFGVPLLAFIRHVLPDDFIAVRHPVAPSLARVHMAFTAVALFSIAHD
jgi:hypothetical protein